MSDELPDTHRERNEAFMFLHRFLECKRFKREWNINDLEQLHWEVEKYLKPKGQDQ